MRFNLRTPCRDCPFLRQSSFVLREGRMAEIADSLSDDHHTFPCHKTTHGQAKKESACAGALAYAWREHKQLSILTRLAIGSGKITIAQIESNQHLIEAPGKWKTD
jgi:hypothetical protein